MKISFSRVAVIADQKKEDINAAMSRVRESVEWRFEEVSTNFDFFTLNAM